MGTASGLIPAQHQADAALVQANPVQNTWYTVLDTTNVVLYALYVGVATTNETLGVRITADGNVINGTVAAVAGTTYDCSFISTAQDVQTLLVSANLYTLYRAILLEARSLKIELRKTTVAGNGTLYAKAVHGRWP